MSKYRESEICQWGIDRNLIGPTGQATSESQIEKLLEEVDEVKAEVLSGNRGNLKVEIGDCYVVLVQLAAMWNLTVEQCAEAAWHKIKDRTGMMIQGKFVKQSDLDLLFRAGWENYAGKMCAKARSVDQRDRLISAAAAVDLAPESNFTLEELGGKKYWGLTL